jgi:hypothetical protein
MSPETLSLTASLMARVAISLAFTWAMASTAGLIFWSTNKKL